MDLVFDLGLQIEFFEQARNLFLNIGGLPPAFDYLVLDDLLDGPEGVAVLHVFEDELTLLAIGQVHVGRAAMQARILVIVRLLHLSLLFQVGG